MVKATAAPSLGYAPLMSSPFVDSTGRLTPWAGQFLQRFEAYVGPPASNTKGGSLTNQIGALNSAANGGLGSQGASGAQMQAIQDLQRSMSLRMLPPLGLWNAAYVGAIGSGLVDNAGTLDIEPSAKIRTLPFPLVGIPPGGQDFNLTLTQAGTLLANGGTPEAYIPVNPTATQTLLLNTVHAGSITNRGTVTISTAGAVTWPSFAAVAIAAGDTIQMQNQAISDATFANACFSFQIQIT